MLNFPLSFQVVREPINFTYVLLNALPTQASEATFIQK